MSHKTCAKCGAAFDPAEAQEHLGQILCEDCYLEALSPTKICDPWAVHTAKSLKDLPGGHPSLPAAANSMTWSRKKARCPSRGSGPPGGQRR